MLSVATVPPISSIDRKSVSGYSQLGMMVWLPVERSAHKSSFWIDGRESWHIRLSTRNYRQIDLILHLFNDPINGSIRAAPPVGFRDIPCLIDKAHIDHSITLHVPFQCGYIVQLDYSCDEFIIIGQPDLFQT